MTVMTKAQESNFTLDLLKKIGAWVSINGQPKTEALMDKLLDFTLREGLKAGISPERMPKLISDLSDEIAAITKKSGPMTIQE